MFIGIGVFGFMILIDKGHVGAAIAGFCFW